MGQRVLAYTLLVLSVLLAAGCAQKSPEQVVTETRTEYFLEPTGLLVQERQAEEAVAEGAAGDGEVAAVAAEAAAAAGGEEEMSGGDGEMPEAEEGPRTVDVLFDLIVRFDGLKESLNGITIEIAHADPFDQEKGRYLQWIETAGMRKGDARQISFEREIPDYETGDTFNIEFREYIPPEERGDYREYEGIGS